MSTYIIKDGELYHYGIKGQRWGRRRFQNEDGSLTEAGVKRYATKGYAQDSLDRNKTAAGRVYDKITDAHNYEGRALYRASTNEERKARAEKYVGDREKERAQKQETRQAAQREKYQRKSENAKEKADVYNALSKHELFRFRFNRSLKYSNRADRYEKRSKEYAKFAKKLPSSKEKAIRAAAKGTKLVGTIATASLMDDIFYGGAGKRVAKKAAITAGRGVVSAIVYATGGRDIHWYDN